MDKQKLIQQLNDIIVKNYDASKGFQNAADNVKSSALKKIFMDCADQRNTFASELRDIIRSLGAEPKNETSTLSKMHRIWMDIKSSLTTDEDEAILEACITGEKAAVKEYDELLEDTGVPNDVRTRLQAQRNMVKRTLEEVRELEYLND